MRHVAVASALIVLQGTAALAQGVLTGVVREDSSARPLQGVEVLIEGTRIVTRTDSGGRYLLAAPAGARVALFRTVGFKATRVRVTVIDGDTVHTDARLLRISAQELDAIAVRGTKIPRTLREAFWERRAIGLGKFLDSTELRKMEARRMSEVLRGLGVRIVRYDDPSCRAICTGEDRAAGPPRSADGSAGCWTTVILDGLTIYRSRSAGRPPDVRRDFPLMSLEAIEYYPRASTTPMEFAGRGTDCGVLVLWTRRAP